MSDSVMERPPVLPWVAPFATYLLWMAVWPLVELPDRQTEWLRTGLLVVVLLLCSRPVLVSLRVARPVASIVVGLGVFALWILPGQLWPGYRALPAFQNAVTGDTVAVVPEAWLHDPVLLVFRLVRAVLLVPLLEEIFWRGFLPRWVVNNDWSRVPMGTYNALAFVGTALLFASGYGPYWDVALVAGVAFNWYMARSRSLGDLVLAHAVTNAALAAYVLVTREYAFWL